MSDAHHALSVITAQRSARADFARDIQAGLRETTFYSTDHTRLTRTIREVLHEDDQYERLTGDSLSAVHRDALRAEVTSWMRYDDLLRASPVPEEEYDAFCRDLEPHAAQLVRILALEQTLLRSPLIVHYAHTLASITTDTRPPATTRDPARAVEQLRDDRHERRHLAHNTYRHVIRESFFDAGTTDLTYGAAHAAEDQAFYEDATGEQFPKHAVRANTIEQTLWTHLLRTRERGTRNRALACRRLRPTARALERVLDIEDGLLTNPLIAHYKRQLDDLEYAVRRADKTVGDAT